MSSDLLTADELAKRLKMTPAQVLALSRAGKLPRVEFSRRTVRFDWDRVAAMYGLEQKASQAESGDA